MAGSDIRAGRAFVEVFLRDKLQAGLRGAATKLRAFSGSIARLGGVTLGAAGTLAAPFIASIGPASDMQETMAKFNTVFGDQADAAKQWGDEFADQIGRGRRQIAGFLASSQDLFVPLGFDQESAQAMSKQLTTLSVDLASFNNMQDADTLRDLQSALTGSSEVMKKYGVIVNQTAVNQELLNAGIKKASEQNKVQARLNIILRGTTAAQGDALRTSDSWANQQKRLAAQLDNTRVALGNAFLPILTPVLTKINELLTTLGGWIQRNGELIATAGKIVAAIAAVDGVLVLIGGAGLAASAVLTGLGAIAGAAATAFGAIVATLGAILSPIGLVLGGVVALTAALLHFSGTGGQIVAFLSDRFSALWGFLSSTVKGMGDALAAGDLALAGEILWLTLQLAFQRGRAAVTKVWREFTTGIASALDAIITGIRKTWNNLTTSIAQGILSIIGLVQRALDAIAKIDKTGLAAKLRESIDLDVEATMQALEEDRARFNQQLEQSKQDRNEQRAANLTRQLQSTEQALEKLKEARAAALDTAADERKQAELDKALKAAQQAPEQQPPDLSGLQTPSGRSAGTFSGFAASLFSQGAASKAADRTAKATEATAENTAKIAERQAEQEPATYS